MRRPIRAEAARAKSRCAIYTRKSSEDGLEQDFNSLDAQREACAAFINSQRHEGWMCLPQMYDDGGVSGASLERPALKRLIADIEAGRIDTVVVYKVDRLTRSLHDFARLVDVFDHSRVSFVSVTQQFNTTTSMGRLTLNMLLTFAQFEREVTSERIRDKIAASKRKGMWMGGNPPLGYDVSDRRLVVNAGEAETVRHIFKRYLELGSVRALKEDLDDEGILGKVRVDRFGRRSGGNPLARATLYRMLQNRLYRGEVVHRDTSYPGEHEEIIDEVLWEEVQQALAANQTDRMQRIAAPSLLAGLLYDDAGEPMTPSHANKSGRRYRYYVSHALIKGSRTQAPRARRVPASEVEAVVEGRLRAFLADASAVLDALEGVVEDVVLCRRIIDESAAIAGGWDELAPAAKRPIVRSLISRVDLARGSMAIHLHRSRLHALIDLQRIDQQGNETEAPPLTLTVECELKRVGMEMRLLVGGDAPRRAPDRSLKRLLAQAQRFQEMALRGDGRTITALAAEAGVADSYFSRLLRLSFLAPDIIAAVLSDRHPIQLNAQRLVTLASLPIAWTDQRSCLGIG